VPAVAWVARRWLGRESAAPAAWMAAGAPFLVWYAQEARNYALLILCATLASGAMLALRERLAWKPFMGYAAAAVTGLLSNFSFALLAPLHAVWWLGNRAERGRRLALLGALLLVMAVAAAPWWSQVASTLDWSRLNPARATPAGETPLRGATTFHAAAVPFTLHAFAVGYTLGPPLRELRGNAGWVTLRPHALELAAVTIVFGLALALGARALKRRGRLGEALLWAGVPMVVIGYFAFMNFKVFHPRYVAVAYPAFLLAMAAGYADLAPRWRAALGTAIGLLWAVSLWNHWTQPRYQREDARGAAAWIRAHGAPGEVVVAANAEVILDYYYRGPLPVRFLPLGLVADPAALDRRLDALTADANGVWVVLSRPEDLDPQGRFGPHLAARYPGDGRTDFEGVEVWHVTRSGASGSAP